MNLIFIFHLDAEHEASVPHGVLVPVYVLFFYGQILFLNLFALLFSC